MARRKRLPTTTTSSQLPPNAGIDPKVVAAQERWAETQRMRAARAEQSQAHQLRKVNAERNAAEHIETTSARRAKMDTLRQELGMPEPTVRELPDPTNRTWGSRGGAFNKYTEDASTVRNMSGAERRQLRRAGRSNRPYATPEAQDAAREARRQNARDAIRANKEEALRRQFVEQDIARNTTGGAVRHSDRRLAGELRKRARSGGGGAVNQAVDNAPLANGPKVVNTGNAGAQAGKEAAEKVVDKGVKEGATKAATSGGKLGRWGTIGIGAAVLGTLGLVSYLNSSKHGRDNRENYRYR